MISRFFLGFFGFGVFDGFLGFGGLSQEDSSLPHPSPGGGGFCALHAPDPAGQFNRTCI